MLDLSYVHACSMVGFYGNTYISTWISCTVYIVNSFSFKSDHVRVSISCTFYQFVNHLVVM